MHRRRVVCTGIGIVSPLGCTANLAWASILQGKSAISRITKPGFDDIPCKVAAFVPRGSGPGQLDVYGLVSKTEQKYMSDSMVYAMKAADEALKDAAWLPQTEEERAATGVCIGAGMVDLETIADTTDVLKKRGYKRVSPYFVPRILINMAAGHISIKYGLQGPNHAASTACTTGSHAIGDAMRWIRNGDADVMVCGSTDAPLVPVSIAGFSRARALATSFNDTPEVSSRPFDKHRGGFVAGEGAGVLVLEEYEHALQRGANMYAEILGYGMSGDAHHMTAPREDGTGAMRCMNAALKDAGVVSADVSLVNAHATSTPLGDAIENRAIKLCFGDHAKNLQINSLKGAIGHLLGAAGSVETAFTILALKHGVVPPSINITELEPEFDLNYVANTAQELEGSVPGKRRVAVKNSFGFGGTNASLCIASPPIS